ncbi:MAG: hypothetical protein Q8N36_04285, partial [bacterium]|nr:hypothetical protein [bacterium]
MKQLRQTLKRVFRKLHVQRISLFLFVVFIVSLILIYNLLPEAVVLDIGQASPETVVAPRAGEDRFATN